MKCLQNSKAVILECDKVSKTALSLLEAVSSNDKGVLHELLVGKELNGGKHMSPEAQRAHDDIKSRIGKDEYDNHVKLAKGTASHIRAKFGSDIASAHWSSKPGDIGRITGTEESQQQNSADIILRHPNGAHVGISLKVTQKKNGKVPIGNPGAKQTDNQLGTNATQHYEDARNALVKKHKELQGKSKKELKDIIKNDPKIREDATKMSNAAIGKIRDEWHDALSNMHGKALSAHIRNNLLHAHETKLPLFKATTGGHGDDHSVDIEHSFTSHDHILNDHKNITVHKSGNNSIEFKHNGKTFLRHRLKPESTPLATALKGSAE